MKHPIEPSENLCDKWWIDGLELRGNDGTRAAHYVAEQAAAWGADQELAECILLVDQAHGDGIDLRYARRPKPPSLKEQAKQALQSIKTGAVDGDKYTEIISTLQTAIELIPDES